MQGSHPNMPVKVQPVRQPVIASPNELVKVFGEEQPISYETLWLALAERLGLPGFGKDGFAGPGAGPHAPGRLLRPAGRERRARRQGAGRGRRRRGVRVFLESRAAPAAERVRPGALGAHRRARLAQGGHVLNRGGRFDTAGGLLQGRPGRQPVREARQPLPGEDGQDEGRLHRQAVPRRSRGTCRWRDTLDREPKRARGGARPAARHAARRAHDQVAHDLALVPDRAPAGERDARERERRAAAEARVGRTGQGRLRDEPGGRLGPEERRR